MHWEAIKTERRKALRWKEDIEKISKFAQFLVLVISSRVGFHTQIQWVSSRGHFEWNMIRQEWIRGNNCMEMKFRIKVTKIYAIPPLTISCKPDRNASKYHQDWEMIREGRIPGILCMGQKWRLTINPTESFPNLLESILTISSELVLHAEAMHLKATKNEK